MKTTESVIIDCAVLAHSYNQALDAYNQALQDTCVTYNAHLGVCESIRKAGFTKVQSGHTKNKKPTKGEFPYLVLANEIKMTYLKDKPMIGEGDKEVLDNCANHVKQKVQTLSFYLETGKFTTNVGKDKTRLVWEIESETYDKLKTKELKQAEELKRIEAIAKQSKLDAANMQAAAKMASERGENKDIIEQIAEEERRLEDEAKEDKANSQAALDMLNKIKQQAADKAAQVAELKIALDAKNAKKNKPASVATATTGKVDHAPTTDKISVKAGIAPALALEVDKAFTIMTGKFTTRQLMYLRELLNKELVNCTE